MMGKGIASTRPRVKPLHCKKGVWLGVAGPINPSAEQWRPCGRGLTRDRESVIVGR